MEKQGEEAGGERKPGRGYCMQSSATWAVVESCLVETEAVGGAPAGQVGLQAGHQSQHSGFTTALYPQGPSRPWSPRQTALGSLSASGKQSPSGAQTLCRI